MRTNLSARYTGLDGKWIRPKGLSALRLPINFGPGGELPQGLFFGKVAPAIAFAVDQFFGMSISMSFS